MKTQTCPGNSCRVNGGVGQSEAAERGENKIKSMKFMCLMSGHTDPEKRDRRSKRGRGEIEGRHEGWKAGEVLSERVFEVMEE